MSNKKSFRGLRIFATILANATAILSANYIVFYILDHYNSGLHFVFHSNFFLAKYLHWGVAVLAVLTGLIYLLLFTVGAYDRYAFSKKRLVWILVIDVLVAGAIAMAINTYSFDWLGLRQVKQEDIVAIATPTPSPSPEPTSAPTDTPVPTETPTPAGNVADPNAPTLQPTDTPTPTPEPTATPIPGLLGDKYAEKFSDGAAVVAEPNTKETLEDGTAKTLLYTYASDQVVIEVSHYQKNKLEYQVADLYVRNIKNLTTDYVTSQSQKRMCYEFARDLNAIIAVNSDYFCTNAIDEGLIIRNGNLLQSKPCKTSDLCVVYQDGTVRCFDCKTDTINNDEIINSFPYHSFYFGPSLLDADGNVKTKFNSPLGSQNPRTAFGYYEPGHYAMICVLGTRNINTIAGKGLGNGKSPGMTFEDLSRLCNQLGMKAAYNFDGGGSSGMYWNEKLFGHNTRETGDVLAIIDPR